MRTQYDAVAWVKFRIQRWTDMYQSATVELSSLILDVGICKPCPSFLLFLSILKCTDEIVHNNYNSFTYNQFKDSHGRAVGIATGYGLTDRGVGVRVPVQPRIFTSLFRKSPALPPPPNLLLRIYMQRWKCLEEITLRVRNLSPPFLHYDITKI
jgi:hypothetical protein